VIPLYENEAVAVADQQIVPSRSLTLVDLPCLKIVECYCPPRIVRQTSGEVGGRQTVLRPTSLASETARAQRVTIRRGSAMGTVGLLAIAFFLAIVLLFSGPTVRHP
jgi:hypothetical protein